MMASDEEPEALSNVDRLVMSVKLFNNNVIKSYLRSLMVPWRDLSPDDLNVKSSLSLAVSNKKSEFIVALTKTIERIAVSDCQTVFEEYYDLLFHEEKKEFFIDRIRHFQNIITNKHKSPEEFNKWAKHMLPHIALLTYADMVDDSCDDIAKREIYGDLMYALGCPLNKDMTYFIDYLLAFETGSFDKFLPEKQEPTSWQQWLSAYVRRPYVKPVVVGTVLGVIALCGAGWYWYASTQADDNSADQVV